MAFVATLLPSAAQAPVQAQSVTSTSTNLINRASYTYTDGIAGGVRIMGITGQVVNVVSQFTDPIGRITGCAGETLPDYNGFTVGLYEPNLADPTGTEIGTPVALTTTSLPAANGIPAGVAPNGQNSNPFSLTSSSGGLYGFLLDPARGQLDQGRVYILVINPPVGSIYNQRRFRLTIGTRNGNLISYTVSAIDGKPITGNDSITSVSGTIQLRSDNRGILSALLGVNTSVCQDQEIQILKTGDRAAAEPGDTAIYRLVVRNLSSAPVTNLVVTDTLPLGFSFADNSARAELAGQPVTVTADRTGSTVTFKILGTLPAATAANASLALNIAYAATLSPDAVRGTGQNSAIVQAQRTDNLRSVRDGPAIYRLRVQPGILSDCGTIIGRVFVDKNFDGEQQPGEPGVPNAVIFMDDGNRIVTDANGLYSVQNVIAGSRTAVLDLSSLPGYTLAPNLYFIERNSQSRLVRLEPGGLVRMNFAVTPTFKEVSGR